MLLGDQGPNGWGIRYATEFHMTNDSRLFPPRPQWEAKGYRPDEYSRWLLGDWRPIQELWDEMGIDPSKPQAAEIELEDWLFDTTAGPERRKAEARFVHGHLLKPGDVARTNWRVRCAQPPYDRLPIPRADLPPGVILSREADAWVHAESIHDVALPVYQGIMIQPFSPSAQGWVSGTGLRANWTPHRPYGPSWSPQYLMAVNDVQQRVIKYRPKIGYRRIARNTDARSFIGAAIPSFPCGDSVFLLYLDKGGIDDTLNVLAILNSFVFDWNIRQRLGGTNLNWYVLAEGIIPRRSALPLSKSAQSLNLFSNQFSQARALSAAHASDALQLAERVRIRSLVDAVACVAYGCTVGDLYHILRDVDLPTGELAKRSRDSDSQDARGFWRVDRDLNPELRHSVLTLVALNDLESKIKLTNGGSENAIREFLSQNQGEGWLLPETLCLAEYGLGHDVRAKRAQPVAARLGPRFYDWQLAQSAFMGSRERTLHASNLSEFPDSKRSAFESRLDERTRLVAPHRVSGDRIKTKQRTAPHDKDAVSADGQRDLFE